MSIKEMPDDVARVCEPNCKELISFEQKLAKGNGDLTKGSFDTYQDIRDEMEEINLSQYALPCNENFPNLHAYMLKVRKRLDQIKQLKEELPLRKAELSVIVQEQKIIGDKRDKLCDKSFGLSSLTWMEAFELQTYNKTFAEEQKKREALEKEIQRIESLI